MNRQCFQLVWCPTLYTITTDREAHNLLKPFEIRGAYCCKEGPTTANLPESNGMVDMQRCLKRALHLARSMTNTCADDLRRNKVEVRAPLEIEAAL